jgi:hypothetical protein
MKHSFQAGVKKRWVHSSPPATLLRQRMMESPERIEKYFCWCMRPMLNVEVEAA